jgi:hypothetical protein
MTSARTRRGWAIESAHDLPALYSSLGALTGEELEWIVFELGLDRLWARRSPGG